jgi:hypothetical protein
MTLAADILTDLTAVFFNPNDFAVAAIYTPAYTAPASPAPVTIYVIFDKTYDSMLGMSSFKYTAEAKTSDVAAAKPRETLVINSVTYKIKEQPHHTGNGTTILELSID